MRARQGPRIVLGVAALVVCLSGAGRAAADVVYQQNFETGSAVFTVNDPYWLDPARANGFIVQHLNQISFPGFDNAIPNDVTGNGFFLFDGTANYNGPGNPNIPPGHDQFFISPTFAVAPNSTYQVSFWLTSANGIANAIVQPDINGQLLGSPVSPVGSFPSGQPWQQFTFSWNSGSNTSATLTLHDFQQTPNGNDTGIDDILVTGPAAPVPEPSTLALLSLGGVALAGWRRWKGRRSRTNTAA